MPTYSPVYPARNPIFMGICVHCDKGVESPKLFTEEDQPGKFICSNCLFMFSGISLDNLGKLEMVRDAKELKNYGSFQWR